MGKTFPHLRDNGNASAFPHVENVRVFKYDNDLDYTRFDHTQMVITCCHVPWDMGEVHVGNRAISGIGNVVYFESKATRDAWFDAIPAGERFDWETNYRNLHADEEINLPLPFDIAAKFNYVRVQYSVLPGEGAPLMYEDEYGLREWFWFVRDIKEGKAPNTSVLTIAPDAWQTFIYDFDVTGLMLERGHAPAFAMDVDEYLSNPIENNEYLLAEDVSFFEGTNAKSSTFLPVGNGEKLIAFALPMEPSDIGNAGGTTWNGNATGPEFVSNDYRDGYRYEIKGYAWKYGSSDLSNAHMTARPYYGRDVPSGVHMYAVLPTNAAKLFKHLQEVQPHVMKCIEGVFMIPSEDVETVSTLTVGGVEVTEIQPKSSVTNIKLTKDAFGYPDKYAGLAKLYTFPYAEIEVSDGTGKTAMVRVEQCGNLTWSKALIFAFPYMEYRACIDGYAGNGSVSFEWHHADNSLTNSTVSNSDWQELLFKFDVPVYELRMNGQQANITDIWEDMQVARERAVNAYHATMRQANTGYENTVDSNATSVSNTQRSTSTAVSNVNASGSASQANTATANSHATQLLGITQLMKGLTNLSNNQKLANDASTANGLTQATTAAENQFSSVSYGISSTANIANAIVSTEANVIGAGIGLDIQGMANARVQQLATGINTGINTVAGQATMLASISSNSDIAAATRSATTAYKNHAVNNNNAILGYSNSAEDAALAQNTASATEQTNRTVSTDNANASRTKSATDSNASASASTSNSNANYSRNASMYNAQDAVRFAQTEQTAVFKRNELAQPVKVGTRIGTGLDDAYGKRGVQIKVRTQPKGAIMQAGDYFLRYGYAYNAYWEFDGNWNVGEKFTYWKAADIWTNDTRLPDLYADRIRFFLLGGVTVWRRPEDIGRATIYENGL